MAQHDYVIANGTGATVRSDLNNALAAIVSQNSGAAEPTTTYAYMPWADITTGLFKIRNATNNGWITLYRLDGAFTDITLNAQGDLRFADSDSSNWVAFQAPATIANNVTWTLPSTDGTNGQVLTTNGTGTLSWGGDSSIPSGTAMLFVQTSAPTGWTKVTTHNDKALRVVSGAASSGGTTAFTSVFASRTPSGTIANTTSTGTVGSTTLTTAQIPSHNHYVDGSSVFGSTYGTWGYDEKGGAIDGPDSNFVKANPGGGGSHNHSLTMNAHNHTFSGTALDFAVQYVDVIIATKN